MHLVQIFMQGGVMMYLLLLITLVLFGIVLRTLWHLFVRGGNDSFVIQNCLDGLLFWGGFAVIIGVLGSAIGYHKAMAAVVAHWSPPSPDCWSSPARERAGSCCDGST
jgi:hypothetical protein